MTAVFWTPQARDDLRHIHEYIAQDSLRYADHVLVALLSAVRRLEQFPDSGRVVPELVRPDVREVIWRPFRIVYHLDGGRTQARILTVFRSERIFPGLR